MDRPKVSVLMITYNHEQFIAQAIDSVLMQVADFAYELVIGEDCSTDRTREIVVDYQRRYPDTIRLLLPEHNLGMHRNFVQTYEACRGEYIALLEGDDYWTDTQKLQKQVEFLESRPDCVACAHNADIVYDDAARETHDYCSPEQKLIWTFEDTLDTNPFPTASMVLRNGWLQAYPGWFFRTPHADSAFYIILTQYGHIGYLKQAMSAYRIHAGGIMGGLDSMQRLRSAIRFYKLVSNNVPRRYRSRLKRTVSRLCEHLGALLAERIVSINVNWSASKEIDQQIQSAVKAEISDLQLTLQEAKEVRDNVYGALPFVGHQQSNLACVRYALPRAIGHHPALTTNIGIWSMAARAYLGEDASRLLRRIRCLVRAHEM